jgi:hypothetical protein
MTVQQQITSAVQFAEFWKLLMPEVAMPERQQFLMWAGTYNEELVSRGITRAAAKFRKMKGTDTPMSADDAIRYASSVMKNESLGRRAH